MFLKMSRNIEEFLSILYLMNITCISRHNISYIGIYINYRVFFLKKVIEENSM